MNGWVNNREAGDLKRHHANYDVIIMWRDSSWDQTAVFLQHHNYETPKEHCSEEIDKPMYAEQKGRINNDK